MTDNYEPQNARDAVAIAFLRRLGIRPFDFSMEPGFQQDYELNWAREQVDRAAAMAFAMQELDNPKWS